MTARRLFAEFVGTAILLTAIVGSGLVTSVDGPDPVQLFQHAVVVGAALAALIFALGRVSGAHFNPSVTFADAVFGGMSRRLAALYTVAQIGGAMVGVAIANLMFGEQMFELASVVRTGAELFLGEAVATFGLVVVVFGTVRSHARAAVPVAVGAYIAAAIFFTSSASFANPAVTVGRIFTGTWTGIAPVGVPAFLAGQAIGTLAAVAVVAYLFRPTSEEAARVTMPHNEMDGDLDTDSHRPDRT